MQTPRASGWQPGQPRPRRVSPFVGEAMLVITAVMLMIAGAGSLMGYVIVNHHARPHAEAGTAPAGQGGGRVAGATTSAATTAAATTKAATTQGATTAQATTAQATTAQATTQAASTTAQASAAGAAVFDKQGCGACHTLKAAKSNGTVGPDLDKLPAYAKQAKQPLEAFVRESIVDPGKYIQPGFQNAMPPTFKSLPKAQLDALVQYLIASSRGG